MSGDGRTGGKSGAWVRGVLDAKEIGVLTKLMGKLAEAGDASTA